MFKKLKGYQLSYICPGAAAFIRTPLANSRPNAQLLIGAAELQNKCRRRPPKSVHNIVIVGAFPQAAYGALEVSLGANFNPWPQSSFSVYSRFCLFSFSTNDLDRVHPFNRLSAIILTDLEKHLADLSRRVGALIPHVFPSPNVGIFSLAVPTEFESLRFWQRWRENFLVANAIQSQANSIAKRIATNLALRVRRRFHISTSPSIEDTGSLDDKARPPIVIGAWGPALTEAIARLFEQDGAIVTTSVWPT